MLILPMPHPQVIVLDQSTTQSRALGKAKAAISLVSQLQVPGLNQTLHCDPRYAPSFNIYHP